MSQHKQVPFVCLSLLTLADSCLWFAAARSRSRRRTWFRTCSRRWRRHFGGLKARQQIVTHRELINRPGNRHRILFHIVFEDAFVSIKVRVPRVRVVLDWILAHADAGQTGLAERSVVWAAEVATARRDRADHAIVFEGFEDLAHDAGGFRRTEDARATHAAGARINIEVAAELFVTGQRFLE